MKSLLSLTLVFLMFCTSSAQEARKLYLGIGTGINYPTGVLGVSLELQIINNLTAYGALGLGSWGGKVGAGIRYYTNYPQGWAFGLGYSYSSGLNNLEVQLEGQHVNGGTNGTSPVTFKLLPVSTINISGVKQWLIGKQKKNRIGLELGYAIPTAQDRYDTRESLTPEGKDFMNLLQPGGLMLGTSFSFGL
jgi:hypothetical protein